MHRKFRAITMSLVLNDVECRCMRVSLQLNWEFALDGTGATWRQKSSLAACTLPFEPRRDDDDENLLHHR